VIRIEIHAGFTEKLGLGLAEFDGDGGSPR